MGNIYKGHILRGRTDPRQSYREKKTFTVEIIYGNKILGYEHGETLEKARIEARKKVDEIIKVR